MGHLSRFHPIFLPLALTSLPSIVVCQAWTSDAFPNWGRWRCLCDLSGRDSLSQFTLTLSSAHASSCSSASTLFFLCQPNPRTHAHGTGQDNIRASTTLLLHALQPTTPPPSPCSGQVTQQDKSRSVASRSLTTVYCRSAVLVGWCWSCTNYFPLATVY